MTEEINQESILNEMEDEQQNYYTDDHQISMDNGGEQYQVKSPQLFVYNPILASRQH